MTIYLFIIISLKIITVGTFEIKLSLSHHPFMDNKMFERND